MYTETSGYGAEIASLSTAQRSPTVKICVVNDAALLMKSFSVGR